MIVKKTIKKKTKGCYICMKLNIPYASWLKSAHLTRVSAERFFCFTFKRSFFDIFQEMGSLCCLELAEPGRFCRKRKTE
jgi:hypothetical protein